MRTTLFSVLALALLAGGCVSLRPGADGALVGPTWRLVGIRTAVGATPPVRGEGGFTLTFLPGGRVAGRADCNGFGGTFDATPDGETSGALTFDNLATTLVACAPPSSSDAFFATINQVVGYDVAGGRLVLLGADGSRLRFERGEPQDDAGWMPSQETLRDVTYICESPEAAFAVRTRTGPGELAVWLPPRFADRDGGAYLVLGQVPSASGAKYQDGPVTVWTKGAAEALVEIDGQTFVGCEARS